MEGRPREALDAIRDLKQLLHNLQIGVMKLSGGPANKVIQQRRFDDFSWFSSVVSPCSKCSERMCEGMTKQLKLMGSWGSVAFHRRCFHWSQVLEAKGELGAGTDCLVRWMEAMMY